MVTFLRSQILLKLNNNVKLNVLIMFSFSSITAMESSEHEINHSICIYFHYKCKLKMEINQVE